MGWERDIIIKLVKLLELIGYLLLFIVKLIKTIINKAFIPIIIGIIVLLIIYYGVNMISLPF